MGRQWGEKRDAVSDLQARIIQLSNEHENKMITTRNELALEQQKLQAATTKYDTISNTIQELESQKSSAQDAATLNNEAKQKHITQCKADIKRIIYDELCAYRVVRHEIITKSANNDFTFCMDTNGTRSTQSSAAAGSNACTKNIQDCEMSDFA